MRLFSGKITPLSEGQKAFLLQYGIKRESESTAYHFLPLKTAIIHYNDHQTRAKRQAGGAILARRYFPILWDGSTGELALDLDAAGHHRVVSIQTQQTKDEHLLRQAYDSFVDFLRDLIRANQTSELLSCIQTPGNPIEK